MISDFKIFPICFWDCWILVYCWSNGYFTFTAKEKLSFSLICSFYCFLSICALSPDNCFELAIWGLLLASYLSKRVIIQLRCKSWNFVLLFFISRFFSSYVLVLPGKLINARKRFPWLLQTVLYFLLFTITKEDHQSWWLSWYFCSFYNTCCNILT